MPTVANIADWAANWKVFDRAAAPLSEGWESSTGTVFHSADVELDLTTSNTTLPQTNTFGTGEQAYIWVYKDSFGNSNPSPQYTPGFEWALVTNDSSDGIISDDWLFPSPSGNLSSSVDWRIEDATAVVFGGLNNTQGDGDFSAMPQDFILQTHTDTTVIPEPSSFMLVMGACLAGLRRKRRRGF